MGEPLRLTPTMSSRKVQALDFIKRYFAEWGRSPSLGEIGAALGVSRQRAHELVAQLKSEAYIRNTAGQRRGLRLVDPKQEMSVADALLVLSEAGWKVFNDVQFVALPLGEMAEPLTFPELPEVADLDHIPPIEFGAGRDDGADDSSG
jgi:SOS-response transcriptional repressor LexA